MSHGKGACFISCTLPFFLHKDQDQFQFLPMDLVVFYLKKLPT